jgi:hypothetical protein
MAKKLKTYETSLGFFDLAIAAPSMRAALEAWGAENGCKLASPAQALWHVAYGL